MPASTPSRRSNLASPGVFLFVVTFTVQLFVLRSFSSSLDFLPEGDDMKFYTDWALRIAHGQWTDHQAFYGLPGYAYLLALIFTAVGQFDPFSVGALQALIDAGISVLLWKISREVFATRAGDGDQSHFSRTPDFIGIAAALAWTFFTPAQAFSTVLMPTIWLVFAYYFCLWFAVKTREASWWNPWLGLGVFSGVIATMVATILFAVPLLVVAIFKSVARGQAWSVRGPRVAGAIAMLIAGLYIGASPAWIHNYFIAHEPVMLTAHSGINFWIGNNPTATGYPHMPPGIRSTQEGLLKDSITLAQAEAGRKLTRAEVSKFWTAKANSYISTHFSAWMRLLAVKFGNFWNAYQYDDLSIIKLLRDEGVLLPGLTYGFIAALGLAGLFPALWRFPRAGWVVAAVLLHMCALMPAFVTERYRLAAVPGLMILGAAGLWIFGENLVRSRWNGAAIYVALCAGAAWFVSIPRDDIGLWSLDHYKAGIRATKAGQIELAAKNYPAAAGAFERAQRNLETAYRYVTTNAEIDFAIGNLWLAKASEPSNDEHTRIADRTRAKFFYRKALELNPHHSATYNNLGILALDEKLWGPAEEFFRRAITIDPDDAKTHYLLALVLKEDGKIGSARSEVEQALHLRPTDKQILELRDQLAAPDPKSASPNSP
jgi:tetratricopeptide (TPR) repeat protein